MIPVLNGTEMPDPLQREGGIDATANAAQEITMFLLLELPVPHTFVPATVIGPVTDPGVKFTVIELVPAPLAIAAPAGTFQL